jgi:hypothetical protein
MSLTIGCSFFFGPVAALWVAGVAGFGAGGFSWEWLLALACGGMVAGPVSSIVQHRLDPFWCIGPLVPGGLDLALDYGNIRGPLLEDDR